MKMNELKNIFTIENRTKYFLHALIFCCAISIAVFASLVSKEVKAIDQEAEIGEHKINPFQEISLEAKSAVVWDVVNQKEIFSKNGDLPLPLASLTKVMTALTADKYVTGNKKILITENYLSPEGDSGLAVGDFWETKDLRDFMLITSSNDGALALAAAASQSINISEKEAEVMFIKKMNDLAKQIGLLNSKFLNEHGLDKSVDRGGAYGSAKDMALLFEYVIKNNPLILEATRYKNLHFKSEQKEYDATNTNIFIDSIPGIIASKTGFTDLAGGNLVVAFDAGLGRPIVVSILGSSREGRFNDALKLVNTSIEYINNGN